MTIIFEPADVIPDAELQPDNAPELSDVEYPCEVCGREAGPYGGRGRKPKRCSDHKKQQTRAAKVTGQPSVLAAQATAVLVQVNGLLAVASMATGMFETAGAISKANSSFEEQAYQALLTDPELCKLILKTGSVSSKMSLALAYIGFGMTVVPTAVLEYRAKRTMRQGDDSVE